MIALQTDTERKTDGQTDKRTDEQSIKSEVLISSVLSPFVMNYDICYLQLYKQCIDIDILKKKSVIQSKQIDWSTE